MLQCSKISLFLCFLFFKQKTAYEMRISDWSSDVCSSDLAGRRGPVKPRPATSDGTGAGLRDHADHREDRDDREHARRLDVAVDGRRARLVARDAVPLPRYIRVRQHRSEENTSEIQSLISISYDVCCLK